MVSTRALAIYVDTASWMVDQLQQVGIDATLEQIETGVWHPKMTRLEYQVALNLTGTGIDDPDALLFENYRCGSQRNFSGYCSEEIDRLMVEQSQTLDRAKRLALVQRDRPQAPGRRRAADPGLGQAVLRALAARQGVGHARELDLQRVPPSGRLARQVATGRREGASHAHLRHQAAR